MLNSTEHDILFVHKLLLQKLQTFLALNLPYFYCVSKIALVVNIRNNIWPVLDQGTAFGVAILLHFNNLWK